MKLYAQMHLSLDLSRYPALSTSKIRLSLQDAAAGTHARTLWPCAYSCRRVLDHLMSLTVAVSCTRTRVIRSIGRFELKQVSIGSVMLR